MALRWLNFYQLTASNDVTVGSGGYVLGSTGGQVGFQMTNSVGTTSMREYPLIKGSISWPAYIQPRWFRVDSVFTIGDVRYWRYPGTSNTWDTDNHTFYHKFHEYDAETCWTLMTNATNAAHAGSTDNIIPTTNNSTGNPGTYYAHTFSNSAGTSATATAGTSASSAPVFGNILAMQFEAGSAIDGGNIGFHYIYMQFDEIV